MKSTLKNLKLRDRFADPRDNDPPKGGRFAIDAPCTIGGKHYAELGFASLAFFDYKPHAEAFLAGVRILHTLADAPAWHSLRHDEYQKWRERSRKILHNTNPPK